MDWIHCIAVVSFVQIISSHLQYASLHITTRQVTYQVLTWKKITKYLANYETQN